MGRFVTSLTGGCVRCARDRVRLLAVVAAVVAAAVPVPTAAFAAGGWTGKTEPNDPGYAPAEHDPVHYCIHDEEWFLFSFIPKCTPLASDPEGAAGMSVDRAWKQFTFGRPDVRIAYMEGGINWRLAEAQHELTNQVYINTGELPYPEDASGHDHGTYDLNGSGLINVQQYAHDPRVKTPYVNGVLTPEDLIVAFGHCQIIRHRIGPRGCPPNGHFDNDGNGYANDISGWNTFRENNDPATGDSAYNHSDHQMVRAAAEGNNSYEGVGVCPGCTIIPVKLGYEGLDATDKVAEGIYFAVDAGASVIVLLDAELGYSDLTKAALNYAWSKGVVVTGASNDFDSSDHQSGMFWSRVWPGNGLEPNDLSAPSTDLSRAVTTYRLRSNATSFGPHALFSVSHGGSTSEATPTLAGVAARVVAEGRQAADQDLIKGQLSAGEVKQVVRETASNIDDPNLGWPGLPGATFNIQYGYGRPNVLKADQAVASGRIPPVPDILAPNWYALYDPTRTTSVPIETDIAAHRATRFTWRVQYGLGDQPTESQFVTIAQGSSNRHDLSGVLAHLSLAQIPKHFWDAPFHFTSDLSSTEQYDVTIRVQATDQSGNMGEDRRVIAVFHDPMIRPGFPKFLGQGHDSQPVLADLQGSGKLDIIFGDSDGYVHALNSDTGRELPGWPAHTNALSTGPRGTPAWRAGAVPKIAYEPIETSPAVGDLFGNGALEVVVASMTGREYVFDRHGRELRGFPRAMGVGVAGQPVPPPNLPRTRPPSMGTLATPVIAPRLPGSSTPLDILQAANDGNLYAFDGHGHDVPGWPVFAQLPVAERPQSPYNDVHDYKLVATPTLADLFGDGRYEIVEKSQESAQDTQTAGSIGLGSHIYVMALWPDGNRHAGGPFVPGWPAAVQGTFDYYGSAQDGITEGVESASAGPLDGTGKDGIIQSAGFLGIEAKLNPDGSTAADYPPVGGLPSAYASALTPADIGNNDRVPTSTHDNVPVSFTASGTLARFGGALTYLSPGPDLTSVVGALDYQGAAQRITNFERANYASTLAPLRGFPAPMMGLAFFAAPAVADIAGGGQPDVINNEDSNNVAAFDQQGNPVPGWPKFTGGWTVWTPAVGDLDSNGHNDVVDVTREGYLFVWNTPGDASQNQAYSFHQDNWHTGRYGMETRPPLVPRGLRLGSSAPVRSGSQVCWTAPGEARAVGTAARYEMRAFRSAPTPESFAHGRLLSGAPSPAPAGTHQCATVPAGVHWVGIRAIGHSGLIGYPAGLDIANALRAARRVCAQPSNQLAGRSLGPVRLGMTRARARRLFVRFSTRGERYMDFFCPAHHGIRVGYPSPELLRSLSPAERPRVRGRAVLALTASPHFALRGVRPGARLNAVARQLRIGNGFHIGLNWWYLVPNGSSRGVLKVRHGIIEEVGIADKQLLTNRQADWRFLRSFS